MKFKNLLKRIPRPLRAIVCTILVLVLAAAYYIALGCPTLTLQQEFRRAEKIHMVGPSTIVDRLSHSEYSEFDGLIVGETKEGICFFGRYYNSSSDYDNPFAKKRHSLSYVRKTGDVTIAAVPNVWGTSWDFFEFEMSLPVYLFAKDPDAVRAEMEITVSGSYLENSDGETSEHGYDQTFRGEATRSDNSFFLFTFTSDRKAGLHALYYLSNTTGGPFCTGTYPQGSYSATVRLYDEAGKLISKHTITAGTP